MPELFYWHREQKSSNAEVDYVIQQQEKIIPIEVKSGTEGKLKSLHLFMDGVSHHMAVRFYAGELHISTVVTQENKTYYLLNLPYYLVSQTEQYLHWFKKVAKKKVATKQK